MKKKGKGLHCGCSGIHTSDISLLPSESRGQKAVCAPLNHRLKKKKPTPYSHGCPLVAKATGGASSVAVTSSKDGKGGVKAIDYQKVYNAIADLLEDENYDDGSYGPVFLRLAWHASGTWDQAAKSGGSSKGTMRFKSESSHSANAGLGIARERLNRVKDKFPDISYGDLWTLAGVCAIQEMVRRVGKDVPRQSAVDLELNWMTCLDLNLGWAHHQVEIGPY